MGNKEYENALSDLMYSSKESSVKNKKDKNRDKEFFNKLPKTTEVIAFRVPKGERERLEILFAEKEGLRLSEGLKKAVYEYVNKKLVT